MSDPGSVQRLRDEHTKVVSDCRAKIQHWEKVRMNYSVLRDRLSTLPDRLHYSIMVPMGPLAFMPGHLIKTNEVTVLLGDNWFASLSAKQAEGIAEHRMQHVQKTIDDLGRAQGSIESRQRFTSELAGLDKGGHMEIREELTEKDEKRMKGKPRVAHSPHSGSPAPPRETPAAPPGPRHQQEDTEELSRIWARLDELEREEEAMDEVYRAEDSNPADDDADDVLYGDIADDNAGGGGDILEDSESNQIHRHLSVTTKSSKEEWEESASDGEGLGEDITEWEGTPTIRFSHTTEPKKVRIDTGRNTTLKFSERREQQQQQQRRRRHSSGSNGGTTTLRSPADIYRWFVDVASGHRRPRKSILKSRSHEDGLGSDEFSYGSYGGSNSNNSYSGSSNGSSSSYNGSSNASSSSSISDSIISAIIAGSGGGGGGGGGCAGDGVFHPSEEGDGDPADSITGDIAGVITGNNVTIITSSSSSNNNNIDSITANSTATNSTTTTTNNNSTCESSITSRSPTTTDNSSEEVKEMSRCPLPDAFSGVVSERSAWPSRGAPPPSTAPSPATARHDDGRGGGAGPVGDGSRSGEPPAAPRRVSLFKAERLASMR